MDSGSLIMSEIVDIPDDSSPSEDSCLMEVGLQSHRGRANRTASEGADGTNSGEYTCFRYPPTQAPESPLAGGPRARRFLRGERSNSCSSPSTATPTYRWKVSEYSAVISKETFIEGSDVVLWTYRSPVLYRQATLASSCSQLEAVVAAAPQQPSCTPEFQISPPTPPQRGALPPSSAPPTLSSPGVGEQCGEPEIRTRLWMQRRAPRSEKEGEGSVRDSKGCFQLVRSHSEPGFGSSTDTGMPFMTKNKQK